MCQSVSSSSFLCFVDYENEVMCYFSVVLLLFLKPRLGHGALKHVNKYFIYQQYTLLSFFFYSGLIETIQRVIKCNMMVSLGIYM